MHQETIPTRTAQGSEGQVSGCWTWTTGKRKSLFCCHRCRWTGSEDHFLSRQKPREEEPGKGHVQTNISTKLKDFQNALGTHTTYRTKREPPRNLNSQQSLQETFLQMFPEKVPCGHSSGEVGGHYKDLPLGDGDALHHPSVKPWHKMSTSYKNKRKTKIRPI